MTTQLERIEAWSILKACDRSHSDGALVYALLRTAAEVDEPIEDVLRLKWADVANSRWIEANPAAYEAILHYLQLSGRFHQMQPDYYVFVTHRRIQKGSETFLKYKPRQKISYSTARDYLQQAAARARIEAHKAQFDKLRGLLPYYATYKKEEAICELIDLIYYLPEDLVEELLDIARYIDEPDEVEDNGDSAPGDPPTDA